MSSFFMHFLLRFVFFILSTISNKENIIYFQKIISYYLLFTQLLFTNQDFIYKNIFHLVFIHV